MTVSRSKRGTTIKATGAAAQALFDRMAEKLDSRLVVGTPVASGPYTIHFEDHGQDFLEWDVDATGTVVGCRPLQGWVWCGLVILGNAQVEQLVSCRRGNEEPRYINYPVAKITRSITTADTATNAEPQP